MLIPSTQTNKYFQFFDLLFIFHKKKVVWLGEFKTEAYEFCIIRRVGKWKTVNKSTTGRC